MSETRTSSEIKYDAFISYRHLPLDKAVAEKLQLLLEAYKPPRGGAYSNTPRVRRIFRDQSELPTSGDLDGDIKDALRSSRFLIVVCSENTKDSQWCLQEIEYFKAQHNGNCNNILTLLVSGDPKQVFPDLLRFEVRTIKQADGSFAEQEVEIEPLAANICADSVKQSLKLLSTEFLRVAAPILGCSFDDLFRRQQRRLIRSIVQYGAALLIALSSIGVYVFYNQRRLNESRIAEQEQRMLAQEREMHAQEQQALANEQRLIADNERTLRSLRTAQDLLDSGDKVMASAHVLNILDSGAELGEFALSEAERLLMKSTYVPKYAQYAVLEHNEFYTASHWSDEALYSAANDGSLVAWNVSNGAAIWRVFVKSTVVALLRDNDILYAATQARDLLMFNADTGELIDEFSFAGETNLPWAMYADIMLHNDTLYLSEFILSFYGIEDDENDTELIFPQEVTAIDLNTKKAEALHQDILAAYSGTIVGFHSCYFDRVRNLIIMMKWLDSGYFYVHDLNTGEINRYDIDLEDVFYGSVYVTLYNEAIGELIFFIGVTDNEEELIMKTVSVESGIEESWLIEKEMMEAFWGFEVDDLSAVDVTRDGKYLAIADEWGTLIIIDTEAIMIEDIQPMLSNYHTYIQFIDNDVIFTDIDGVLPRIELKKKGLYNSYGLVFPNAQSIEMCETSPDGLTLAVIDSHGMIGLFSLQDAYIESYGELDTENIFGTDRNVMDIADMSWAEEGRHLTTSPDNRFKLVEIFENNEWDALYDTRNVTPNSYWVADNITGEKLYKANLPMSTIGVSIKDDTFATILTISSSINDVNMRTGEILRSVKIHVPHAHNMAINYLTPMKFKVDYEMDKVIIARSDIAGGAMNVLYSPSHRGIVASYSTGDVLFEFSDFFGDMILGIDEEETIMYKYNADDNMGYEIRIPTFEQLIELARIQAGGRTAELEE